jgi:hypothetical protein
MHFDTNGRGRLVLARGEVQLGRLGRITYIDGGA